jgi:PTS system ascorbate-specific IIA component
MRVQQPMVSILIVAHAPLASCLLAVARHAFADASPALSAVDVEDTASLERAQALVAEALAALPGPEVLVMVDVFGATPGNAAMAAVDGVGSRVVVGANVPMLWRTLCYANLPLAELVTRAVDGGRQGIMQVAPPRRQNQANRPGPHDSDSNPDQ